MQPLDEVTAIALSILEDRVELCFYKSLVLLEISGA